MQGNYYRFRSDISSYAIGFTKVNLHMQYMNVRTMYIKESGIFVNRISDHGHHHMNCG